MSMGQRREPTMDWTFAVDVGGYEWSKAYHLVPGLHGGLSAAISESPEGPWLLGPTPWGTERQLRLYDAGRLHRGQVQPRTPEEKSRLSRFLRWRRDMHLEFSRLSPDDNDEALSAMRRFANRFGMLGVEPAWVFEESAGARGEGRPVFAAEHLATWQRAISDIKGLTTLISACKREVPDIEFLWEHVVWRSNPLRVGVTYQWPGSARPAVSSVARDDPDGFNQDQLHRWARMREPERLLEPLTDYLYSQIENRLEEHVTVSVRRGQRGIIPKPKSLLGAMLLMCAGQLAGDWPTLICPGCNQVFVPRSRRDQEVCSEACKKRMMRKRTKQGERS